VIELRDILVIYSDLGYFYFLFLFYISFDDDGVYVCVVFAEQKEYIFFQRFGVKPLRNLLGWLAVER